MPASRQIAILALLALLVPLATSASTPQVIRVQGFLSDKSGGPAVPADGDFDMTFELWDSISAGTLLASHGPVTVTVTDGIYEVDLPFPTSAFDGSSRYLEVIVDGENLAPRLQLTSTPYAYVAERVGGFAGTDLEESDEITAAIAAHTANPEAHHPAVVDTDTSCDGQPCDLRDPSLVSCDSVDTDAAGNLICGSDAVGPPPPPETTPPVREFCFDADDMKAWDDSFASLEALDGSQVDAGARAFDRDVVEYAGARFKTPGDLDPAGTVGWRVFWEPRVAPLASASVVWDVDHLALGAGELRDSPFSNLTLGPSATGTSSGTMAVATGSTTVAALGWLPHEMVHLRLARDAADPADDFDDATPTTEHDDALLHMFCVEVPRQ